MRCFTFIVLASCLAYISARHVVKRDHDDSGDSDVESELIEEALDNLLPGIVKRHHLPGHDDTESHDDDDDDNSGLVEDVINNILPDPEKRDLDDDDDDDDDSDSDDDASQSLEQQCQNLLIPCLLEVAPYAGPQGQEELKRLPVREQCQKIVSARNCFRTAVEHPSCANSVDDSDAEKVLKLLSFMNGVISYVCEDKLTEFETHEQCLKAVDFDKDIPECRQINQPTSRPTCPRESIITCTNKVIADTPQCAAGAQELIAGFVRKISSYIPQCQVPGLKYFNKLVKKLLK